ncbi:MAG: 30S ribosome-binding factor RbfA [Candidatus Omnitrophica bacterium]|nr:30S ribosome-binding factor RbfA [Candidatus Omnitrophota bacterium]
MQGKRKERVAHLLQMELSRLLVGRMKDPRIGFITITHVEMPPDLKSAIVFYSVIGDANQREETQSALEHSAGFLQKEIAHLLKLRYTPRLKFRYDDSLNQGIAIDAVLRNLKTDSADDNAMTDE